MSTDANYNFDESKMLAGIREFQSGKREGRQRSQKIEGLVSKLEAIQEQHLQLSSELELELDAERERVLRSVDISTTATTRHGVHRLIDIACIVFRLTPHQWAEATRERDPKRARFAVIYLLRERGLSLPHIGRVVGRHHTSVMYALETIETLMKSDASFRVAVERIRLMAVSDGRKSPEAMPAATADRRVA